MDIQRQQTSEAKIAIFIIITGRGDVFCQHFPNCNTNYLHQLNIVILKRFEEFVKNIIYILLLPTFCYASTTNVFKSSCCSVQYSIKSFYGVNNLNDDQNSEFADSTNLFNIQDIYVK